MSILLKPLLILVSALLIAALCVASWQHLELGTLQGKLTLAQTQAITAQFDAQSAALNTVTVTRYADRLIVVHDTTHTIQLKVPDYVPPSVDRDFPLPLGFVRLHDAAVDLSELPSPGAADAQASTVTASAAAGVIVGNYGTCHEIAEQLTSLQDWEQRRQAWEAQFQQQLARDDQVMPAGTP